MKPFEELTYRGKIGRMRKLAQSALNDYELGDIRISFLRQAGNTLFRINQVNPGRLSKPDLYKPGQYLLRIHDPGYQTPSAVELELEWLSSMCREATLPVPEPALTLAGRPCTQAAVPGVPGKRVCSLLRWVKGRELEREEVQPHHYTALGELMAKMHRHSANWQPPAGSSKRKYDWDGLFRKEKKDGSLSNEIWQLLPPEFVEAFEVVSREVKQIMDRWGKGPTDYGLIHGDLGMGANVLVWKEDVRVIDFDDSGFGYYMYDLSIVLEDSQDHQIQSRFRDALLEGYTRILPLSDDQLKSIDLFLAAFAVYWSLYAAEIVPYYLEDREEIFKRMARYNRLVENYLSRSK